MILVSDILEEIADDVGGHGIDITCSDAAKNKVLKVYHEASRKLMARGDFEGTDREVCLQVTNGCVTLDRRIETVKQFLVGNNPGRVQNDNFRYIQQGTLDDNCYPGSILEDLGDHFPLIVDLPCQMAIMAVSDRPECETAKLTVNGTDSYGREVSRQWDSDKGFQIPIAPDTDGNPVYTGSDAYNSGKLSHVSALSKPRTNGYVYVYGYIPGFAPVWLVTMAPDETRAQHRRYRVPGIPDGYCIDMTAKCSMRWVKQYPSDIALIQNIDAFQWMAQALTAKDDGQIGEYNHLFNKALAELKYQRAKKHPANSATLNVRMSRRPIRSANTRPVHHRYGGMNTNLAQERVVYVKTEALTPAATSVCNLEPACTNGFTDTAATDILALRTVFLNDDGELELATPDGAPAEGLIKESVEEGKSVFVYQAGPVSGFTDLEPGETYYLGDDGIPTTESASSGWDQSIGVASSTTVLVIAIGEPILLS